MSGRNSLKGRSWRDCNGCSFQLFGILGMLDSDRGVGYDRNEFCALISFEWILLKDIWANGRRWKPIFLVG